MSRHAVPEVDQDDKALFPHALARAMNVQMAQTDRDDTRQASWPCYVAFVDRSIDATAVEELFED